MHLEARKENSTIRLFGVADKGMGLKIYLTDLGFINASEIPISIGDKNILERIEGGDLARVQNEVLLPDSDRTGFFKIAIGLGQISGIPSGYHREVTRAVMEVQEVPLEEEL